MNENAPVKKYLNINIGDVRHEIRVNEGDTAEIIQKRVDDVIGAGVIEFLKEPQGMNGQEFKRSDYPGLSKAVDELYKTPNCAVCRWKGDENYTNGLGMKSVGTYPICHAQASKECSDVYNSEECKALFEPVEYTTTGADISKERMEFPGKSSVSYILNNVMEKSNIAIGDLAETFRIIVEMADSGVKFPGYFKEKPKLIIGDCQSCKSDGVYVWSDTYLCKTCDKKDR